MIVKIIYRDGQEFIETWPLSLSLLLIDEMIDQSYLFSHVEILSVSY